MTVKTKEKRHSGKPDLAAGRIKVFFVSERPISVKIFIEILSAALLQSCILVGQDQDLPKEYSAIGL